MLHLLLIRCAWTILEKQFGCTCNGTRTCFVPERSGMSVSDLLVDTVTGPPRRSAAPLTCRSSFSALVEFSAAPRPRRQGARLIRTIWRRAACTGSGLEAQTYAERHVCGPSAVSSPGSCREKPRAHAASGSGCLKRETWDKPICVVRRSDILSLLYALF